MSFGPSYPPAPGTPGWPPTPAAPAPGGVPTWCPTNESPPLPPGFQYNTDEDIYVTDPNDFELLVPHANAMAAGRDGSVGVPGQPWVLTSPSNNFAAQGVAPGMVLELERLMPRAVDNGQSIPPPARREIFAVAGLGVAGNQLMLRRCGMPPGAGMPPPVLNPGELVGFGVYTFGPQVEAAAYRLDERFGVDPMLPNRSPGDEYDRRVLRRASCLWVLYQAYAAANRAGTGDFAKKIDDYRDMYNDEVDRAVLRWGPTGRQQVSTASFNTRLSR